MDKLTKEQAVVITAFTGQMVCRKFSDLHEDVEKRLGRPVFTHEFANKELWEKEIKPAYEEDFMWIIPE